MVTLEETNGKELVLIERIMCVYHGHNYVYLNMYPQMNTCINQYIYIYIFTYEYVNIYIYINKCICLGVHIRKLLVTITTAYYTCGC